MSYICIDVLIIKMECFKNHTKKLNRDAKMLYNFLKNPSIIEKVFFLIYWYWRFLVFKNI